MKKGSVAAVLAAGAIALLGLAGCGSKVTSIEVNQYVDVEFEGYDSQGQVSKSEFNAKKLLNDNEKVLEEVGKKEILKLFGDFVVKTDEQGLSNGDTVQIDWKVDEDKIAEFEKEHKVKFVYDDFDVDVSGLQEMEKVDIFENLSLMFRGNSSEGTAYFEIVPSTYPGLDFRMDKAEGLANGDTVTVTAYAYGYDEDASKYLAENYKLLPKTITKTFTVSGLMVRVEALSDVPADYLNSWNTECQNKLAEQAKNWNYPDSYQKATFMGNIMSTKNSNHTLYFIYKVDVDSARDGAMSYYTFGSYTNPTVDEKGNVSAQNGEVSLCTSYFRYNGLSYYGYQTYEKLLEKLNGSNITLEEKVDTSIITKVTHEPRDYSKVTATPVFTADCFSYELAKGGTSYVTGFTEKGYTLIHTFSANDCISITLPETASDGSVVEGISFEAGNSTGPYSFARTFDDKAPCYALVFPDSYKYLKSSGDAGYKLRSINFGNGITEIGQKAFRQSSGLQKVVLPASLEKIGYEAFSGCRALSDIGTIPDTLTVIESYAFNGCRLLTIPTLETSGKKIGDNAFNEVTINSVTMMDNTDFRESESPLFGANIGTLTIGETVVKIPDYAFCGIKGITEIVLPEGLLGLGSYAFSQCKELEKVTLPESLITIGPKAFVDCSSLKSINLTDNVVTIGESAFSGCTSLVLDRFNICGKKIGWQAFNGVTANVLVLADENFIQYEKTPFKYMYVKSLEISENVTKIPDYTFSNCKGLTEVTIPDTVIEIGKNAFEYCDEMKSITLSKNLVGIGELAFRGCSSLKTVEIPASVALIGSGAFRNCESLVIESLDLANKEINRNAFTGATINELKLNGNAFTNQVEAEYYYYDSAWEEAKVKKIVVTEDVTEIPAYAFCKVEGVTEITIPSTVTKINSSAFAGCKDLRMIHLTSSVKNIASDAFRDCVDLVFYSSEDSVAKTYAAEHNFFFRAEETTAPETGAETGTETGTEGEAEAAEGAEA